MRPDLEGLKKRALAELATVATQQALEQWRADYLGRRDGAVTAVLRSLAQLPPEERRAVGAAANALKTELEQAHAEREQALAQQALEQDVEKGKLDVTLPGRPVALGRYHPVTRILREVLGAFATLGFEVVEGPEVEWDYYNFEALNIPQGHPARDMWNTLWVDTSALRQSPSTRPFAGAQGLAPLGSGRPLDKLGASGSLSVRGEPVEPRAQQGGPSTSSGRAETSGQQVLLRTHTSPMQVRIMEQRQPPVRVVVPGKVYRYEATDATHEWMFTQVEGLAVDEGITFIDLKATLYEFARQLFGAERKVRFRCDYFPFVEPGCEMAIDCFACSGSGRGKNGSTSSPRGGAVCGTCRGDGWIEILGAGMVHPQVLERVGYDSRRYTGFAFGMGAERIAMLKHGIDDIRLFYSNDLRFLRQF